MARRVLYLSPDGLLEPLGFSQVARVVEGLSRRGWQYRVASLEKPADLADTTRVTALRRRLAAADVDWSPVAYDWSGSSRAALTNIAALSALAHDAAKRGAVDLIHARSYHGGLAAMSTWLTHRVPYVFDTRAYWIDERLEEGRWFTTPLRLSVARGVEFQLFNAAAAVVSLTQLQADDVIGGRFGNGNKPVACIPTCADYDDFTRRPVSSLRRVPDDVKQALAGKLVLGIVGSLNRSYLVTETLDLCRRVFERRADARLLILSSQKDAYEAAAKQHGLPMERIVIAKASHDAMPEWLSLIDVGTLLLLPNTEAKRASMPTKLAEFFACGIRPVQFGCNEEVRSWVERAGSGLCLPGVDAASLSRAADAIAEWNVGDAALTQLARERTQAHFTLASGVERYDRLLRAVFG